MKKLSTESLSNNNTDAILPIHGSFLGGVEVTRRNFVDLEEKMFQERCRREKALFDLKTTALSGLREALEMIRKKSTGVIESYISALRLYEEIADDVTLDTPNELLLNYHALLLVEPFFELTE